MSFWHEAPARPELGENTVDLWLVRSDDVPDALGAALSEAENARARKFKADLWRNRYRQAQAVLREILSRYIDRLPAEIEFVMESRGKPFLRDREVEFNLSHSGDLTLIGVTRGAEIGVDLEMIRDAHQAQAIAKRYFTAEEFGNLLEARGNAQHELFFQYWTQMEAIGKAWGIGVGSKLSREGVSVQAVPVESGWRASMARRGPVARVNGYRWSA